MKAVIMAGGEGTRLRPLTCDLPKPMARLCGRPVLDYALALLHRHGLSDATLTLQYLPDVVAARYGGTAGLRLEVEDAPLGTAGSVKRAVGDAQEEVVVLSGDALTDIDLTAAIAFHRQRGAAATMVVKRVEDPRAYGLVRSDEQGRVTGFIEKPGWAQAVTDVANTGIYILSPAALACIPDDTFFDFAKDVFPLLLSRGAPLYAFETQDYWCDMGTLEAYREAQRDLLAGRVRHVRLPAPAARGGVIIEGPVYIGEGVHLGDGARIGPYTVLDDDCCVGAGAKVRDTVVGQSAYVGERASLCGAVLCHGASVERGASVFEDAVLGAGSVVGEYATVCAGVKVWPGKRVEDRQVLRDNIREGHGPAVVFDDAGLLGETGVELTPALCARIGAAAGSLTADGKAAVGSSGDNASDALKQAVVSGLLSTGATVWDFGACIPPQFDYFVGFGRMPVGLYVSGGPQSRVRLVGEGGLPAARPLERALEQRLASDDVRRVSWDAWRQPTDMRGMQQLYRQELVSLAPLGLGGQAVTIRGADSACVRLLREVCTVLGCELGGSLRLHVGADGRQLSVYDEQAGYLWPYQVLALCCLAALEQGQDVALPADAPQALDELAAAYGRRVWRYSDSGGDEAGQSRARALAMVQPWARDGLMMAVQLLYLLHIRGESLRDMAARLPQFAVSSRVVSCRVNPGRVLQRLSSNSGETVGEGVCLRTAGGVCQVRPSKRGKTLILSAEAADAEIADELCGQLENRLQTVFLDIGSQTGYDK